MDLSDLPTKSLRLIAKAEAAAEYIFEKAQASARYSAMTPKLEGYQAELEPEPDQSAKGRNDAALHLFHATAGPLWERVQPDLDAFKTRLDAAKKWVDDKFHPEPGVLKDAAASERKRARREVAANRTAQKQKEQVPRVGLGVLARVARQHGQALMEGRLEGYIERPSTEQPFVPRGLPGVTHPPLVTLPPTEFVPLVTTVARNVAIADNKQEALFRKGDLVWTVSFSGKTAHVKDLVGMGYIAELLRHPRAEIEAAALVATFHDNTGTPIERKDTRVTSAIVSMPGIPVTDAKAIRTVKAELTRRENELKDTPIADQPTRARLTGEISKLRGYLAQTEGHRGKPRITGGAAQRSRSSVKHAIERAIAKIAERHTSLANHLQNSIRTGTSLVYMPTEVPDWQF